MEGEVWNFWLWVGFGKLFSCDCNGNVIFFFFFFFFEVWMYEYFGVDPEILEKVDDIYSRFLRWLPKYHLSMPSRCSLEIWRVVIDNLTVDDVSPSFFIFSFCLWGFWCLMMVWSSFDFGFFVIFRCL